MASVPAWAEAGACGAVAALLAAAGAEAAGSGGGATDGGATDGGVMAAAGCVTATLGRGVTAASMAIDLLAS